MDFNWTFAIRIGLAFLLGGVIGVERDVHGRAAGLRTHMLVCAGAALYTIASLYIGKGDPGRIAAHIVSGIGFLGAGTILKAGFSVRGLTTAACMWLVAAVGLTCGMGMMGTAVYVTIGTMMVLMLAKRFETHLHRLFTLKLRVHSLDSDFYSKVLLKIEHESDEFSVTSMDMRMDSTTGAFDYEFLLDTHTSRNQMEVSQFLVKQIHALDAQASEIQIVCLT